MVGSHRHIRPNERRVDSVLNLARNALLVLLEEVVIEALNRGESRGSIETSGKEIPLPDRTPIACSWSAQTDWGTGRARYVIRLGVSAAWTAERGYRGKPMKTVFGWVEPGMADERTQPGFQFLVHPGGWESLPAIVRDLGESQMYGLAGTLRVDLGVSSAIVWAPSLLHIGHRIHQFITAPGKTAVDIEPIDQVTTIRLRRDSGRVRLLGRSSQDRYELNLPEEAGVQTLGVYLSDLRECVRYLGGECLMAEGLAWLAAWDDRANLVNS